MTRHLLAAACIAALAACSADTNARADTTAPTQADTAPATGTPTRTIALPAADGRPFVTEEMAQFKEPWAMTFLPDGRLLVTEKPGTLKLFDPASGRGSDISGVPEVAYGGQGGLGDVVLHPGYADNGLVYISYAEAGDGGAGGVVARARLRIDGDGGELQDLAVIWRQVPKVSGQGHYAYRIAFDGDGMLWITSGERQKFDPSQDMASNLGKVIRLHDDGSVPADNPFADQGGVAAQVWSLGHRNPLGLAFDGDGRLWVHEMGPKNGDELNRIERGANYGYPLVSDGEHYDGRPIPDHATRPEFNAPAVVWTPVISPRASSSTTGTGSRTGAATDSSVACRRRHWCGWPSMATARAKSSAIRCRPASAKSSRGRMVRYGCSRTVAVVPAAGCSGWCR